MAQPSLRYALVVLTTCCLGVAWAQNGERTPYSNLMDYINGEPLLSTLLSIPGSDPNMYSKLESITGNYTIVLPTVDAFQAYVMERWVDPGVAPEDMLAFLWVNTDALQRLTGEFYLRLLPYAMVPTPGLTTERMREGQAYASAFVERQVWDGPLLPTSWTVHKNGGNITIQGAQNSAQVVKANQLVGNLVCHLINRVLVPPDAPTEPLPPPPGSRASPSPSPSPAPTPTAATKPPSPSRKKSPPPPARPPSALPSPSPAPSPSPSTSPSPAAGPSPKRKPGSKKRPPPPASSSLSPSPAPSPSSSPAPSPKPSPKPGVSPSPPDAGDTVAARLASFLGGMVDAASKLLDMGEKGQGTRAEQALRLVGRLSPHLAAQLARDPANVATLFLPEPQAIASTLAESGAADAAALPLPDLLSVLRRTLAVTAFHASPGGPARRLLPAADLRAAAAQAGGGGGPAAVTSMLEAPLRALLQEGSLRLQGYGEGPLASVLEADMPLMNRRLLLHLVDAVLQPPEGAALPVAGPKAQAKPAASALAWLSDPANLDAVVWRVLDAGLGGPEGPVLGPLWAPGLVGTLFVPEGEGLLSSPGLMDALAGPIDSAAAALTALLNSHFVPGRALSKAALAAEAAAGRGLLTAAGEGSAPLRLTADASGGLSVEGVPVATFDRQAGQVLVHVIRGVLPVRTASGGSSPSPSPSPAPKPSPSPPSSVPSPSPSPTPVPTPRKRPPPAALPSPSPKPSPGPAPAPTPSPVGGMRPPSGLSFASLPAALKGVPELSSMAALYESAATAPQFGAVLSILATSPMTLRLQQWLTVSGTSLEAVKAQIAADPRVFVKLLAAHTLWGARLPAAQLADGQALVTGFAALGTGGTSLKVLRTPTALRLASAGSGAVLASVLLPDVGVAGERIQAVIHVVDGVIPPDSNNGRK
ncbi:hypothetical protein HYH03_011264 [Edaphochlamys debaryana]|uniref:FAS1 domain-containing protein n=1 Tax=Edaphochlamys debaryana TaxID=47281 RepID=A0A835XWH0_9CHLO|nr:hypothetical protein HYH03_011264 [Edaphochlamys debaryana]|eukprot:KAG2490313.1 hypothetical protein HYH03_011264 [Edaphochlamys debaryana]